MKYIADSRQKWEDHELHFGKQSGKEFRREKYNEGKILEKPKNFGT